MRGVKFEDDTNFDQFNLLKLAELRRSVLIFHTTSAIQIQSFETSKKIQTVKNLIAWQ
jgi:hypothetical protein